MANADTSPTVARVVNVIGFAGSLRRRFTRLGRLNLFAVAFHDSACKFLPSESAPFA